MNPLPPKTKRGKIVNAAPATLAFFINVLLDTFRDADMM
jgi:hypothetical protein